ncbi:uncharacterized protein UV8b_06058 [Ustilaginoidea virens]|uniref:Transaldolase n=1 Tax=Ustilaginoidea virens TaxID=1159556 RepID=A0A8E5MJP0_USTVR|nr:uncharacterized protein UV8b_06058 [Ustilaginoidea virens]QUC21817.1 hypothetical protein UV8b_06058 [Ustilaginoidea virens]
MGSRTCASPSSVTLLEFLRSKSSIDYDSLDMAVARQIGPFADCTSNQWDAYVQLSDPTKASVVKESLESAQKLHGDVGAADMSVEELAVEIAMIKLALASVPFISGSIHVMCNPFYAWDADKIYQTGHRFRSLCRLFQPDLDLSRLVMKVSATWEGMQACRRLRNDDVKTLATTLFTMEQAVLAGEAGCTSVSPFAHELRVHADPSYIGAGANLDLIVEAQRYYRQHGIPTKVKACSFKTPDEMTSMAGIDAMTLPAGVLLHLDATTDSRERLEARCVLGSAGKGPGDGARRSYIRDRAGFNRAYLTNGMGKAKTEDAIAVFCGFQMRAEELVRSVM